MRPRASILLLTLLLAACGSEKTAPESTAKTEHAVKPTVTVPPAPQFYEGTPYWLTRSAHWPAVMEWTLGPEGEYVFDSLTLRLSGKVLQSFISGPKGKEHPLMCWFDLSVRPIPRKLIGYSFNIDSVVFHDPIKKRRLRSLPMLSSERHTEMGVVRTTFSNNLAVLYTPDLEEDQPLEPTVYITSVEKKTIKVTMAPITCTFLRQIKPEETPTDSLQWGPS
ncbi:MAG TPA: hypothetical protein VNN55_12490 [bacterium]|nr:hypothetical protein [bacterium]